MNKVSVIVPVFGVEAYLEDCVNSLLAQSYKNLEILLIDDASPDRCPAICDAYMEKDSRVITIHKKNGGAASARNVGLDHATGEYICFVDSDDVLDQNYVDQLLKAIGDGDAAVCAYSLLQRNCCTVQHVEPEGEYSGKTYLAQFTKSWRCALIWNKIFRREIIGNIRFPEGHKIDDEFFTYKIISRCQKITVIQRPLYYYRLRRSSVMNTLSAQQQILLDRVEYMTQRLDYVADTVPALEQDFFIDALDTMARYWHHSKDMPQAQREIRRWVRQHTPRLLKLPLSPRQKLGYLNRLYLKKPMITAEPNPILVDKREYFD